MKIRSKLALGFLTAVFSWSAAPALANIEFYTAGGFSGPNANGSDLLFTDASGTADTSVSFGGAPSASLTDPGTYLNQDFGVFDVSTSNGPVGAEYLQPGNSFELVVIQSNPTSNSSFVNSSLIQGTVVSTGGALFVEFTSGNDLISFDGGAEKYTVKDVTPITIDSTGAARVNLTGTVSATPSPSSALGGVIFCALLFLGRPRRNPTA